MRGKAIWAILFIVPALLGGLVMAAVLLTPLPEPNNPEVTEFLDASGGVIARRWVHDRIEIPVQRMPKELFQAIVLLEDQRFYQHHGVDLAGIGRAVIRSIDPRPMLRGDPWTVQGGSTITQQLARSLTFGDNRLGQERTLTRKAREAIIALKLERKYSKEQILGLYWNSVYLGQGAYGLERAAQTYFNKSIANVPAEEPLNLTLGEIATLAALPQWPEYYSLAEPDQDPEDKEKDSPMDLLRWRRNLVLTRMAEEGFISAIEAQIAQEEPIKLLRQQPALSTEAPHFVNQVIAELKARLPALTDDDLARGGYKIYTSLNPKMQQAADAIMQANLPKRGDEAPEVALVAIDPATGQINALVGGRQRALGTHWAREPRQPGSTFKPFVYATALTGGNYVITNTQIDAVKEYPAGGGRVWRVPNFDAKYSQKPETMRTALQKSLNTVTVDWMNTLKPGPVIATAQRVGLTATFPANDLSIGLGTTPVTPIEMTAAFAALANGGRRVRPHTILRVEDREGRVYLEQRPELVPALDPGVAFLVTDMLKGVLRWPGTAAHAAGRLGGRPAAGKSGTTDQYQDAWFVGYTPTLVAGLWAGYAGSTTGTQSNPLPGAQLMGGAHIAPLWADFMASALAGTPHRDWSPPPNVVSLEICTLTGLLPNASCPVGREWYLRGSGPTQVDPTSHWGQTVPRLPGVPWVPSNLMPPWFGPPPAETPPERPFSLPDWLRPFLEEEPASPEPPDN